MATPVVVPPVPENGGSRVLRTAAVSVALASGFLAGLALIWGGLGVPGTAAAGSRLFSQVLAQVEHRFVDSLSLDDLYERASEGLVGQLDDPHAAFLSAAQLRVLRSDRAGGPGTLGMELVDIADRIFVRSVAPGSAAEAAGVAAGQRLLEVNGESVTGLRLEEVTLALAGDAGSEATIALARNGQSVLQVKLARGDTAAHAPFAALLQPNVGYVRMFDFGAGSGDRLSAAVDSLVSAGMESLILDVRGASSGELAAAVETADLFLPTGLPIASTHDRNGVARERFASRRAPRWPELVLTLLVDEWTAGAGELVAGTLQEHERAIVVGAHTLGRASTQQLFPLSDGSAVKLTTARWYTALGRAIEALPRVVDPASAPVGGIDSASVSGAAVRTDSGRELGAGGGIVPDLAIGGSARVRVSASALRDAARGEQVASVLRSADPLIARALDVVAGVRTQPALLQRALQWERERLAGGRGG